MHEREREIQPSPHPAGIGPRSAGRPPRQADAFEQLLRPDRSLVAREAVQRRLEAQMLPAGQHLVRAPLPVVRHRSFPAPACLAHRRQTPPTSVPPLGVQQRGEDQDGVDLPAPLGPRNP